MQHQERLAKPPRNSASSTSSRPEPAARVPSEGVTNLAEEGKDATAGPGHDKDPDPDHQNDARDEGKHEDQLEADRRDKSSRTSQADDSERASLAPDPMFLDPSVADSSKQKNRLSSSSWEHVEKEESPHLGPSPSTASKSKRPSHINDPLEQWELDEMEELLGELCGHLGKSSTLKRSKSMC